MESKNVRPRAAYIEYTGKFKAILVNLRDFCGVEVADARTLEEFLKNHGSLDNFPCLLYHPGVDRQHTIKEVRETYPMLNMGVFTGGGISSYEPEVIHERGVDFIRTELEDTERWVRNHQSPRKVVGDKRKKEKGE